MEAGRIIIGRNGIGKMDRSAQVFFRKAAVTDIDPVWRIILQAKEQMRLLGSRQWQDGYPALDDIRRDIADGCGYVLAAGKRSGRLWRRAVRRRTRLTAAIEGEWLCQPPYVVVHRLAVAQEMRRCGLATRFMREVETFARNAGLHSFRVDTNFDNRYMRSLLSALGFTYCGEIFYADGSRRAYEKPL